MSNISGIQGGVLVTGGGGFLGSHLCEYYVKKGVKVIAVDNFCTGLKSNAEHLSKFPNVHFVEGDVCEDVTWERIRHLGIPVGLVFHFASPASPPHYQRLGLETMAVNSVGLQKALAFADTQKARVVFASTSEIYGDPHLHPQPESYWGNVNTFGPRSCYDESKRFGESLIYTWNLKYKTKHGFVRIFNTYGPRMNPLDGRVLINFLEQALTSKPLTVYGHGNQTRSFCYVDDLIDAITRYAASDVDFPINMGNDKEFSMLELAKIVQDFYSDKDLRIEHKEMPIDDPQQRKPDLTLAKKHLDWEPKISLQDGILKMSQWLETELNPS